MPFAIPIAVVTVENVIGDAAGEGLEAGFNIQLGPALTAAPQSLGRKRRVVGGVRRVRQA